MLQIYISSYFGRHVVDDHTRHKQISLSQTYYSCFKIDKHEIT